MLPRGHGEQGGQRECSGWSIAEKSGWGQGAGAQKPQGCQKGLNCRFVSQTGAWDGSDRRGECLTAGYTSPSSHNTCSHSPLFPAELSSLLLQLPFPPACVSLCFHSSSLRRRCISSTLCLQIWWATKLTFYLPSNGKLEQKVKVLWLCYL